MSIRAIRIWMGIYGFGCMLAGILGFGMVIAGPNHLFSGTLLSAIKIVLALCHFYSIKTLPEQLLTSSAFSQRVLYFHSIFFLAILLTSYLGLDFDPATLETLAKMDQGRRFETFILHTAIQVLIPLYMATRIRGLEQEKNIPSV